MKAQREKISHENKAIDAQADKSRSDAALNEIVGIRQAQDTVTSAKNADLLQAQKTSQELQNVGHLVDANINNSPLGPRLRYFERLGPGFSSLLKGFFTAPQTSTGKKIGAKFTDMEIIK